jgi:serine/threonine protein kinase
MGRWLPNAHVQIQQFACEPSSFHTFLLFVKGNGDMQARQLGSYELIRRLGEGGMARVYLARDIRLGREVAVKVLEPQLAERPGFRERFLREARVAASLDHPHIVPLYDFGESESLLYLVMPYVSGGSLQDILKRAPLLMGEVVAYGSQIADALDYAHRRKVIHRDVKPANMLLHADGRLMLSDFGLAKILDRSRPNVSRGHPDAGTPEYMAPEQIEGHTDERSDVYALGVVLYLLLTGRLPFTGSTSSAVMDGHLYQLPNQPRQLNPAVTPAIQEVVLQALAKHPDDRFQRAGDLSAALLAALVAGDAEPLPFSLESDELSMPGGSFQTPGVSLPSYPMTGLHSPPAPLPWEIPDPHQTTPRQMGAPSLPAYDRPNLRHALSDLPTLGLEGMSPHRGASSPAALGTPISPLATEISYGRLPIAEHRDAMSPMPLSGLYSAPGLSARVSAASSPMQSISHVTGPYPVAPSGAIRSTASGQVHGLLGPKFWVWTIVTLMLALLALAVLLRWF